MEILTGTDNEVLRTKSEKVTRFDKKLLKLAKDMEKTMIEAKGVGLAAPQVGENKRFFLALINKRRIAMVNPEITSRSFDTEVHEEGCLSLPDSWGHVRRSKDVIVKFQDLTGKAMTLELSDLESRIVQHELDHLDGVLFVDRIEETKNPSASEQQLSL